MWVDDEEFCERTDVSRDVRDEKSAFSMCDNADTGVYKIKKLLMDSRSWPGCASELVEFHRRCGSGIFSRYRAFVWRGGAFEGVGSPDPVRFSDLISYELEREDVIQNTLHFLDGKPANNILLYGDRGTGKSTTVKALVNEYHSRGLRMIELPKRSLADFPLIIRQLAGRNLKFILFVDDLAFEDNEENYTALKAALEGGLESKPDNVLIYATSNRKHLIKERFSDRAGLGSGNTDDEVRAADTMQEKLSLSDRFGMTVVFSSPDKKQYLEIVEGLAKKRGLNADREYLQREAMKWELQYNGRSPRTARQFVDWLEGQLN
jgi:predicted AAA+ superfamily ATPase